MEIVKGKTFKELTSLAVGGEISELLYPKNKEEIISYLKKNNKTFFVIGNGTNILSSDKYFDKPVISLKKMKKEFKKLDNYFTFSANITGSEVYNFVSSNNVGGSEFISTIPGQIGGLITMNAGCYNKEISDCFVEAKFITKNGEVKKIKKNDMNFGYRSSAIIGSDLICIEATFYFDEIFDPNKKDKYLQQRIKSQPKGKNAGSVFKNPNIIPSWMLIDSINFRGYKIGGAKISDKHSNFIENNDNASAKDIYNLLYTVQENILEEYGIKLENEWIILNF